MKLSLKAKIIATSLFVLTLCIGISLFASWRQNHALEAYKYITENNFLSVQDLGKMEKSGVLLEAAANLLIGSETTAEDVLIAQKKIEDATLIFEESSKKYESLRPAEGEADAWKKLKEEFWKKYTADLEKIVILSAPGKKEDHATRDKFAAEVWSEDVKNRRAEFKKISDIQNSDVTKRSDEARAESAFLMWLVPCLLAITALISIAISVLMGTTIGRSFMKLAASISESSHQVAAVSTQIASSSQTLSQATTEQASSLEETASALEEISAMISKASESAGNAATSSVESQGKAEQGRGAVDQMLNSMTEISQSNEAIMNQINVSNQQMTEIVKVIQEIGNKTKVINDIVFQTKLLSFNASVEAARAGEHGKGFAVVAEEVGNLAQMSGNAAKEISEMLSQSTAKVETIVSETKIKVEALIEQGKRKVESGVDVAKRCSVILNEIVHNVSTVSGVAQEISQASKEQSQGVSEINKAMGQLDSVTQQNASASESTSMAAGSLSTQAATLKSVVDELVSTIQGGTSSSTKTLPSAKALKTKPKISSRPSNVVEMKKPQPKKSEPAKFERPAIKEPIEAQSLKKASGHDLEVPSCDDSGFES